MRGVRSFVILLVVALGLGTYLYFVESKREPGDAKKNEKVFAGVESDKIDRVTLKSEKGETSTVEKKSGTWHLTQPVAADADPGELSGITTNLSTLEVQRVVDEQATDFKQYGLDPPRVEVAFKAGDQERRLLLGQKTPSGSDLYAKVPDKPRVFLVSSFLDTTFNRSPFDLRDKSVLKVERDKIDFYFKALPSPDGAGLDGDPPFVYCHRREKGRNLRAVAWAPDGVIEGLEATDRAFLLAVQWHAESLTARDDHRRLFESFVAAADAPAHARRSAA